MFGQMSVCRSDKRESFYEHELYLVRRRVYLERDRPISSWSKA